VARSVTDTGFAQSDCRGALTSTGSAGAATGPGLATACRRPDTDYRSNAHAGGCGVNPCGLRTGSASGWEGIFGVLFRARGRAVTRATDG
jgi:hypothetical protein